jgi:hypothetical protein
MADSPAAVPAPAQANTDPEPAADAPRAYRISFSERETPGETVLRRFRDPAPQVAVGRIASVEEILSSPDADSHRERLDFIFLPSGSATPIDLQRRAEGWIVGQPDAGQDGEPTPPAIDLVLQSDRIVWRPGKAVVVGSARRLDDWLPGLVDFSFYEAELGRLERELADGWPTAEADVALTHSVGAGALARREHVNQTTRETALRRIRLARLSPHLEKPTLSLSGPARRLVSELANQADVADRLKYVDDRLEVFENLYELANDRLSEYSHFVREYRLELWIVALLVVEALLILVELWLAWGE